MKTKLFRSSAILMLSAVVLASSCKDDDERLTAQDTVAISEEATIDSYYQDTDDMSAVAIQTPSDIEFNGGRTQTTFTVEDTRFHCGTTPIQVTFERLAGSTTEAPKGKLTVDFGTGCTDLRGNTRKGKIIITFSGRRFVPGSTVVTTFENYFINNVQLEGTRTLTNVSTSTTDSPKFNVVLTNGKATFADGREATRESNITFQWIRASNPVNDQLVVDQSSTASGVTRNGRSYQVSLLEDLTFQRLCGFAVSGIKKYVIDGGKEITIDYGDGTCDHSVTVTVNGVTRVITVD